MADESLDALVAFAESLAEVARTETLPRFRTRLDADNKLEQGFDPVTDADREAERAIRARIEAVYPEHGILGEEHGEKKTDSPWRWVLDPVDGTRAFICGVPTWTTLIALEKDERPVIGVIDQGYTKERWVGSPNGAFFVHDGERRALGVTGTKALAEARVCTTDPRPNVYFDGPEAEAFAVAAKRCRLARFGYDAYAYGMLACGQVDAVVEGGLQRYDFAALVPIIRGAGGVMTNWGGEEVFESQRGQTLAAATPELHAELQAILSKTAR